MSQNLRNAHIDIMKGFAILLVLLGHRFMTNTVEGVQHPMTIIIYSFSHGLLFLYKWLCKRIHRTALKKKIMRVSIG